MKRLFSFTLIPAALLGAAFVFLSPKDLPAQTVTLAEIQGAVQYQAANADVWAEANTGMELHENDSVKTGPDGSATIVFHDSSSSRLASDSEILIEDARLDGKNQTIGVRLASGRVWSRILKLLDKDTTFEVRTSSTVATVRGTTLDVGVDETEKATVAVADGTVDVAAVETERATDEKTGKPRFKIARKLAEVKVEKDKMVEIPKIKTETAGEVNIAIQEIREEIKKADWFQNNTRKDGEFEKQAKEKILERVKQEGGILPDSPFYQLKRAAEEISMKLPTTSEKRRELAERFAERRLKEAVTLNEKGNADLGKRAIEAYEKAVEKLPEGERRLPQHLPKVAEWLTDKPFVLDALKDRLPEIKDRIQEQQRKREAVIPQEPNITLETLEPAGIKENIPAPKIETPAILNPVGDKEKIQALRSKFEQLGEVYARIILLAESAKTDEARQLLEQFRARAEGLTKDAAPFLASDTELRALTEQIREYLSIAKLQIANPSPIEVVPDNTLPSEEASVPLP